MITVTEQISLIIFYTLFGMFIAITYDTLNILMKKVNLIIRYIVEILYWIGLIILSTLFIIKNTANYITLYAILFYVLGAFIYYSLLSKTYNKTLTKYLTFSKEKIFPIIVYITFPVEVIRVIKKIMKKISFKKWIKSKIVKYKEKNKLKKKEKKKLR